MQTLTLPSPTDNQERVKLSLTARGGFVAPEDHALCSLDYSNQELYIIAWLSQDPSFLKSFREPKALPLFDSQNNPVIVDGRQIYYPNPDADLHTLTAVMCCFPHLFQGKPKSEWVKLAKDESLITRKGDARYNGKITNFGLAYMQTAQSMAELNYLPVDECKEWIKRHESAYPVFHAWSKEFAAICAARGWAPNARGRIRWVAEDNAKAAGASPGRSGVNHVVQGLAACMTKLALHKVRLLYKGTRCKLCMLVHDEVIVVLPGKLVLNQHKCILKHGIYTPVYEPDEELTYWSDLTRKAIEEAEHEIFNRELPGLVGEPALSKIWAH